MKTNQKKLSTFNNIVRLPIRSFDSCKRLFDDTEENEEKENVDPNKA